MAFLLNSQAQGVSGKINKLPKHHGAGPNAAACKMSVVSFALAVIFIIRLFILHDTEMSISLFSFVVLVSEEEV